MLEKLSTVVGETLSVFAAEGEDSFLESLSGLDLQTQLELLAKLEALADDTELSASLEFPSIWSEVLPETNPKTFYLTVNKDALVLSLEGENLIVLAVVKLNDNYSIGRPDRVKAQSSARIAQKAVRLIGLQEEL